VVPAHGLVPSISIVVQDFGNSTEILPLGSGLVTV
jgi:hypothetical protein